MVPPDQVWFFINRSHLTRVSIGHVVGNALRLNPFSPHIPCHRVIASNLFLGGFFGEWGKKDKTGQRYDEKILLLSQEGVHFSSTGILLKPEDTLWKPTLT